MPIEGRGILSPVRLPVPPLQRGYKKMVAEKRRYLIAPQFFSQSAKRSGHVERMGSFCARPTP